MKIKTVAQKFGVNFDPHYMIIDACKAIGFAIKKYFPKCTLLCAGSIWSIIFVKESTGLAQSIKKFWDILIRYIIQRIN